MRTKIEIEVALDALNLFFDEIVDAIIEREGDLYPSTWKRIEDSLAQARAMIRMNLPNVQFLKRIMGNECTMTDAELIEVERIIPLDDFNNDNYDFIGNFTINDNEEEFKNAVDRMCCGIFTAEYVLESGKKIFFGFDYGH